MSAPKQQTAVQWLEKQFVKLETTIGVHGIMYELIEQAKAMEKEQIKDAWKHGNIPTFLGRVLTAEQYYKENYETI
jgi:hypothetical protein